MIGLSENERSPCWARNNNNRSRTNRIDDVSWHTMNAVNRYLQGVASHKLVVAQEEMDSASVACVRCITSKREGGWAGDEVDERWGRGWVLALRMRPAHTRSYGSMTSSRNFEARVCRGRAEQTLFHRPSLPWNMNEEKFSFLSLFVQPPSSYPSHSSLLDLDLAPLYRLRFRTFSPIYIYIYIRQ